MKKLLLNLQFYTGDRDDAFKLAAFIANIEPRHRRDVDFMFSARFDTLHNPRIIELVSRKFDVRTFTSTNHAVGHPYGPNRLWFDSMIHLYDTRDQQTYDAVLCFEADACPLRADWIDKLIEAWDSRPPSARVIGHLLPPPPTRHINGNCLVSGAEENLGWIRRIGGCSPAHGWDTALARRFEARGWADTPTIRSHWRLPTLENAYFLKLCEEGCVLFHGCKDDSAKRLSSAAIFAEAVD